MNNSDTEKSKGDINPFFSFDTLMDGGKQMLNLIRECA